MPTKTNSNLQATQPQQKTSFWTTNQVVRLLKLSDPKPLYLAKAQNQPYQQGKRLVVSAGKRNCWLVCRIMSPLSQERRD